MNSINKCSWKTLHSMARALHCPSMYRERPIELSKKAIVKKKANVARLKMKAAAIMRYSEPSFKVRYSNMQMQTGPSKCGFFVLVFGPHYVQATCAEKSDLPL